MYICQNSFIDLSGERHYESWEVCPGIQCKDPTQGLGGGGTTCFSSCFKLWFLKEFHIRQSRLFFTSLNDRFTLIITVYWFVSLFFCCWWCCCLALFVCLQVCFLTFARCSLLTSAPTLVAASLGEPTLRCLIWGNKRILKNPRMFLSNNKFYPRWVADNMTTVYS